MISRREFLKLGAAAGASLAVPWGKLHLSSSLSDPSVAYAFSQSDHLKKFIQPLRMIGKEIPIAQPDPKNPGWWQPGVTHYSIDVAQFSDQLHPDLPHPTRLWGFGHNQNYKHLGGVIATKRDNPVQITFKNKLPLPHILPVDDTIMGVMGNQNNRCDIHLHGGFVPWSSDGGPHAWWDPKGHRGPSFVNVLNPRLADNEGEYYYPNEQSARLMWYHDHAFGLTRLNAYAGIATGYVIYDDYELALVKSSNLPGPLDPRTVYLVFQDKVFVNSNIQQSDPTWTKIMPNSRPGDLWYAHKYEADQGPGFQDLDPSCVPEFFGDTILVNGTVYPFLEVEQRQYRFRLLNACNARFLNPRLVYAHGSGFPDSTEANPSAPGPAFIQIGTEGGFLPSPVMVNGKNQPTLFLAPAERADLIVDFRNVSAGSTLILYSDAPAPFPMGDDANDYTPPRPPAIPGFGPNTRTLLQIRVKARSGAADNAIKLPMSFQPTDPFLISQKKGIPTDIPQGAPVRYLTLNEDFDQYGRLIQKLGTADAVGSGEEGLLFGRAYMDDPTEVVSNGDTEVWEIANLTGDTHPIHFHLVNVQVLSRQPFDADNYAGSQPVYTGRAVAPDDNELGWKETIRMNPEEVTRVLMEFKLPTVPFTVPVSPRTGDNEYVWHCHILEHEEHDMMRPLIVK